METTKPSMSTEVGHSPEGRRGDTWSAEQMHTPSPSEIRVDDGTQPRGGLAYAMFANDREGLTPTDHAAGDSVQTFRWWPASALFLASVYSLFGVQMLIEDAEWVTLPWKTLPFISAALLVAGMAVRRKSFHLGTTLIVLGCPLAFYGYWMVFPPALALIIILGVIQRDARILVFDKRVLFGVLLAFLTALYIGVAVGVGTLVSSRAERDLWIPIAVTAIVAVLFQPIRVRLQRFADRFIYGERATPYEVLAHFADRVAGTYATEDVLPKMARALQEGTSASRAEVWLRSGDRLRLAASSPVDGGADRPPVPLSDGKSLPDFAGVDRAIEIQHQGELLGALTLTKPPGESLRAVEDELLQDLASQAGLVMRNVSLNQEVLARVEELKASRQRLVAAQDEARRRLERNLHDGAQQHLVALKVQLSLVERVADSDKVKSMLRKVASDADEALEALRDLARGIYPPLLADQGLAPALAAQARKAPIAVGVQATSVSRHSEDEEAAVYFCCLEAVQNAVKHAQASRAEIELTEKHNVLTFCVSDNGRGFDLATTPQGDGLLNMADRLEAMGGTLEVRSSREDGTSVTGHLPL